MKLSRVPALITLCFLSALPLYANSGLVMGLHYNFADYKQSDSGITANRNRPLSVTTGQTIYGTTDGTPTAGAAIIYSAGWDNGSGTKAWHISMTTEGFQNLTLTYYQRSRAQTIGAVTEYGPRDFKVQYSTDSSSWTDVSGTVHALSSSWQQFSETFPAGCENKTKLYLRWVMVSNTSINGGAIATGALSDFADLRIRGEEIPKAPTAMALSSSSVCSSMPAGTTIGVLSVTDQNVWDTYTYSIISSSPETAISKFAISGDTLKITEPLPSGSYSLTIKVSDGTYDYTTLFTINVSDYPLVLVENSDWNTDCYIIRVQCGLINNSSGMSGENNASGYSDFTGFSTNAIRGDSLKVVVTDTVINSYGENLTVYFDWNADHDFSDANETFNLVTGKNVIGKVIDSITVKIPDDAALGTTLMRIALDFYGTMALGTPDYGEVEDYTLNVVDTPDVATDTKTNIQATTVTLNGSVNPNNSSTIVSFEYGTSISYGNSTVAAESPVSGTAAIPVSAALSNLLPGTTYHYRVAATNAAGTAYGADSTFTTTKGQLTISAPVVTLSKTYDKTRTATVTAGTLSGVAPADAGNVSVIATAEYDDSTVGTRTITITYSISGSAADRYITPVSSVVTGTITAKPLTITGVTAQDKVYDGTTEAILIGGSLDGVLTGDIVGFTLGTATFDNKNVGDNKAVTVSGCALTGSHAANYSLSGQPSGLTASITAKPLTITGITAQDKVYDGTTEAALSGGSLDGVLTGDIVGITLGSATFDNKNVGDNKAVTVSGCALTGSHAANYSLSGQPSGLTADITRTLLTITADDAMRPVTGEDPIFTVSYSGFVHGEDASVVSGLIITREEGNAAGTYAIIPSGATAANYEIIYVNGTLSIEPSTAIKQHTIEKTVDRNSGYGIIIKGNPVSLASKSAVFTVANTTPATIKVKIYDALANVVYGKTVTSNAGNFDFTWDLTTRNGRQVASGTYLIVVRVQSRKSGATHVYKAKLGVTR